MRSFTANMSTYLSNKTNIEPVTIIGINWTGEGSEVLYADKDIFSVDGKILAVGGLDDILSSKSGQSASLSVKLDDIDGTIKGFLDTYDVYNARCNVYQTFDDPSLTLNDKFILFTGQVTFDVKWSEGERTVDLTILTKIEEREVGFSPEEGQFDFVAPDAVGKAWTLCFGSPLHVPATLVKQVVSAKLNDRLCIVDPVLYYKRFILTEAIYANYSLYIFYKQLVATGNNLSITARQVLGLMDQWARLWAAWDAKRLVLQKKVDKELNIINKIRNVAFPASSAALGVHRNLLSKVQDDLRVHLFLEPNLAGFTNLILTPNLVEELKASGKKSNGRFKLSGIDQIIALLEEDVEVRRQGHAAQFSVIEQISKLYQEVALVQLEICKQERCVDTVITVRDSERFPQGETVEIILNNMRFRGIFNDTTFTIESTLAKYFNVKVAARQVLEPCSDMNIEPFATFWVEDVTKQLKGMYAVVKHKVTGDRHIIKIEEQVGTRCTMKLVKDTGKTQSDEINSRVKGQNIHSLLGGGVDFNPYPILNIPVPRPIGAGLFNSNVMGKFSDWSNQVFKNNLGTIRGDIIPEFLANTPLSDWMIGKINELVVITQKQEALRVVILNDPSPRDAFTITAFDFDELIEVAPVVMGHWFNNDIMPDEVPSSGAWSAEQGATILNADDDCEVYIANILKSEIKSVSAYRVDENGVRSLTSLPTEYYTTQTETLNTTSSTPFELATVRLLAPLSSFNEQWEDQIYVSLTSDKGPNVSKIIEHLVLTYTDKQVDAASFAAVEVSVKNYPANFALLDRKNVFQQINEIAFQARCIAYVKGDKYYLKYLSIKPDSDTTIGTNLVEQGSMTIGYSDLTDIATRITALWKPDYLPDTKENRITLRHNIEKYGLHETEINFYIYNIEELVIKSATYWLIQDCNSWKYVEIVIPVSQLNIEMFDAVTLTLPGLVTSNTVLGIVEEYSYDSDNNNVSLTVRLPVRSGEQEEYIFAWPGSADKDLEFPEELAIDKGYVGSGNPIISGTLEKC